ncbi:hypothetical protein BcepF1.066 [Burkholderia phage BcepF1]|uniref:Uncharacterized protein n=1 Tax=Burkholderia phage BcepF1 TaxID=2886897 RepID=A1YZX0_9CAUD|nr:hypothetical protein BcepF1.066 [Burkholderia phage BcepF1]ABL96797.1 hypothetical protein BcepF1.066 [Burkholderia phage BcepF1]
MSKRYPNEVREILDEAPAWNGQPVMPPQGALVLIRHGSDDKDHVGFVTGFRVAEPATKSEHTKWLYRVFVEVSYLYTTDKNERILGDVRPLIAAQSIDSPKAG